MIIRPRIWIPVLIGIGLWIASGVWLDRVIGWPERYGFHCVYRDCLIADFSHSTVLLRGGTYERLKFIHIWLPFIALAIFALWLKVRSSGRSSAPSSHSISE